jgi:hypothetical protein
MGNVNQFGADNHIFLQTALPNYVTGQVVQGNIYLNMLGQFQSQGIFLTLKGFESVWWTERRSRQVQEGDNFRTEYYNVQFGERRQFFNSRMLVYNFQGTIFPGQYTFPFQFQLPPNLPGNFCEALRRGEEMNYSAQVCYVLEAEADAQGWGRDITYCQPLLVDEALRANIQPVSDQKVQSVMYCCCLNKGDATMKVHFDKNCYVPGETAQIVCEADNRSSEDFTAIRVKLMRRLTLRAEGQTWSDVDVLFEEKYPGVPANTNATGANARSVPIRLLDRRDGILEPQTSSALVRCEYWVDVEFDIPMCPDIEIHLPITIYAPQPVHWGIPQQPAFWNGNVMPQAELQFQYGQPQVYTGYGEVEAMGMGMNMGQMNVPIW